MFIGCAMIPIITLAVLAYTSVSRELVAQSHVNVGRAAKAHAISIFDRLLSVQNQLQLIRLHLANQAAENPSAALTPMRETIMGQFASISIVQDGRRISILKDAAVEPAPRPLQIEETSDAVQLQIQKRGELAPPQVIMRLSLSAASGEAATPAYLEAEVQPAFLWGIGHANTLPARTDLVVIDDDLRTLVNTSELDILSLKKHLQRETHNRNEGFRYREKEIDYHVSAWPLFLTPSFGIGTWRVAYIQAESVVLTPIHAFKRSFMLIFLLTFWIVLLLSLRHIRRAVVPLRRLYTGTRKLLTGDYTHRITVDSEDEFAQVSAAFNQMTDRIGRQVRGLRTMADIGRETAAVFGIRPLIRIEMDLMARQLDFAKGMVLLLEEAPPRLYCAGNYGFDPAAQERLDGWQLNLGPHGLTDHPDLGPFLRGSLDPPTVQAGSSYLNDRLAEGNDPPALVWTPIVYEKTPHGFLGVSPMDGATGGQSAAETQDLLQGIAAQTAVALHGVLAFKQLERSEARFRDIFASAASGMALISPQGDLQEVNQRLAAITGYPADALKNQTLASLLAQPEEAERLAHALATLGTTQTTLVMEEFRLRHADGNTLWGLVSLSPYYGEGKGEGHLIVQLLDLTEQKRAEAEKQAMAEQLQQAQKMEAIGTLAGGIAHDFNNILGGIMGFAQLGCITAKAEEEKDKFTKIMTASERAQDLVQQILTFSRQGEQRRLPLRLDLILKEALKLLRASIPAHIEIKQYVPVVESCILADATQMHQIIMNLCTNAYHAMEEKGGRLKVELHRQASHTHGATASTHQMDGPFLEMTVSDTGRGMDAETLARIFDPYFTTKPQGKGTGLGLAVVHGIVERHGGTIGVASTPGEGTTFRVCFPEVVAEAAQPTETATLRSGAGERVLLVDDEALIIDMGSEMLTTLGYRVTTALDPREALDSFRSDPLGVDLVITDLAMPHLKGDDLARALHTIRDDLPVILCSGFNGTDMNCPEADQLFQAQLSKPFSAEALQAAIETALAA